MFPFVSTMTLLPLFEVLNQPAVMALRGKGSVCSMRFTSATTVRSPAAEWASARTHTFALSFASQLGIEGMTAGS